MSEGTSKKDLEDKIKELKEKLSKISDTHRRQDEERAKFVITSSPIGQDKLDTIKRVSDAKRKSEQKAGLIKLSDDGSVWEEDEPINIKIPTESIHEFSNLEFCECGCHDNGKKDCMHCYDHPTHLEAKRRMKDPVPASPTESEPEPTKSRLKRLLDW